MKDNSSKAAPAEKLKIFLANYFNYLIVYLLIIIFAIGFFTLIYPKYKQIAKDEAEAGKNLRIEYETKFNYLNSIRNLQKAYRLISAADKEKVKKMVPEQGDTGALITEIEAIVKRNGARLNSIKIDTRPSLKKSELKALPGETKEPPAGIFANPPQGVSAIKISANLSSTDYSTLKNIIKTLENNLRLFDIAEINFETNKNSAILSIYCYYFN